MTQINRREFLGASASLLTAAALPAENAAAAQGKPIPKLFDGLAAPYAFTDQQGRNVNLNALQTKLKDDYTVLSFGFSRCPKVCPQINANMAKLGKAYPNLKFIVVSTDAYDNLTLERRVDFMDKLKEQGLDPSRVTILYPSDRSKQGELMQDFGEPFEYDPTTPGHTSLITLFGPGGLPLGQGSGKKPETVQEFSSLLQQKGLQK